MIRIKKFNPRNQKLIDQLVIEKEFEPLTNEIFYRATIDGKFVADVIITKGKDYISDIYIDEKYRKNGIGTFLYDYVEKDLNIVLEPSGGRELKGHSFDGKRFWIDRLIKRGKK